MKQKAILTSLTTFALLAGSAAASASSQTFNLTPATAFLVTEANAAAGVTATSYNGSINYTTGLWAAGGVSSAILTLNLQDDTSTNAGPTLIDIPREWAKLTSVSDGSQSLSTLPALQEVDSHLITGAQINGALIAQGKPTLSTTDANIAAARVGILGLENVLGVPPSTSGYFNLDVSSLLNASNSGVLNFGMGVDSKYADIPYSTSPLSDYQFVNQALGGVLPPVAIWTIEDYLFKSATLTVTYAPVVPAAVPVPGAVWLFGSALAGLIGFRRKSV
jgi:hypothetical protein